MENFCYNTTCSAGVAHLVERHLAKVEVASSSLVTRSKKSRQKTALFFFDKKSAPFRGGFYYSSVITGKIMGFRLVVL